LADIPSIHAEHQKGFDIMKHIKKSFTLALCAALLLCPPALAAKETAENTPAVSQSLPISSAESLSAVQIQGTVTKLENGSLSIKSAGPDGEDEVIVHVPDGTPCVDAATGGPLNMETVKNGDTLCVWAGPAMTMSLPPQTTAVAIVGNLPADGAAPQYAKITGPAREASGRAVKIFPIAGGALTVSDSASVTPYATKNRVTLSDLTPGAQVLTWTGDDGAAERVLLLPYAYLGYLTASIDGEVRVNDELLDRKGRVVQVEDMMVQYLPLRAVAEAVGYDVEWISGKGAIVSLNGTESFTVLPGSGTAQTSDGEYGLLSDCVIDNGVTYLPASDISVLLDLYLYTA